MTIANWIIFSLIIITAGLLIFAYIKKISILKKICAGLIIPLFAALDILLLSNYLPDSLHLIKMTATALSLTTISTILITFEQKKLFRVSGRFLVLAGAVFWILLYKSIFYIYKVPLWLIILMSVIYLGGLIATLIISGKQRPLIYVLFTLCFALSAYLHFCSFIFLCFERRISSVLLFCGASLFLGLTAFHFINQTKLKIKHATAIRYSLIVASQVLIACSNILLIR